jgi:hypothetical protein
MASINSAKRRESISKDRGQRVLKRRSLSHNLPTYRATRSTAQKDRTRSPVPKKRRTTRSQSRDCLNKENVGFNNKFSPPLTRSAKKKRLQNSNKFISSAAASEKKDGLLVFSPPDQTENARREKIQREKRMKER